MENLPTIPLRRIVDLQDGTYCDRVALYENLRLTSKTLYRALPPLQPTERMVSSCNLVRTIAAATRVFTARLRSVLAHRWSSHAARQRAYAAARPSVAEYDAFMADVRRLGATGDLTNPELADLLLRDEDLMNFRLRIYLHSQGLKIPHTVNGYQVDPENISYLQLNPDVQLNQSNLRGTWSGVVTLSLKAIDYSIIQAPEMEFSFDYIKLPTAETTRQFWEAAGVHPDKLQNNLPDETVAVMPADEAVVLLQNLPPGYAVGVEGQEGQLNVICATGLVED